MAGASPAYLEITDFLAAETTRRHSFRSGFRRRLSDEYRSRIARRREGAISAWEALEPDDFLELDIGGALRRLVTERAFYQCPALQEAAPGALNAKAKNAAKPRKANATR